MNASPDQLSGFSSFLAIATEANLGLVIAGGLIGGLLQPVFAKLNPRSDDPPNINFLFAPILGVAAAGISIYVIANSDTDAPMRILFFALLCGLAFPAILTSAVDNVARRTETVQKQVAQIASDASSDGIAETAQAASQLKAVLSRNPSDTLKSGGQAVIEKSAKMAVNNIANTAMVDPAARDRIVQELREVKAVADAAGWNETASAAADQANILESIRG